MNEWMNEWTQVGLLENRPSSCFQNASGPKEVGWITTSLNISFYGLFVFVSLLLSFLFQGIWRMKNKEAMYTFRITHLEGEENRLRSCGERRWKPDDNYLVLISGFLWRLQLGDRGCWLVIFGGKKEYTIGDNIHQNVSSMRADTFFVPCWISWT